MYFIQPRSFSKHNFLFIFIVFILILQCIADPDQKPSNKINDTGASAPEENVVIGFVLVIFGATLSTLGAAVVYLDDLIAFLPCFKPTFKLSSNKAFLASALSYSAGVLTVTIFHNVLPEGLKGFHDSKYFGSYSGLAGALFFALCMSFVFIVKSFSKKRNARKLLEVSTISTNAFSSTRQAQIMSSREDISLSEVVSQIEQNSKISKEENSAQHKSLGYEIALGIALHNFPEGVLTFVSTYESLRRGLLFGVALALHKFPEGIMVGVPIYAGTGSKFKAVLITAAASYITQLLGACFAYLMFKIYWNDIIGGILFLLASAILISTLFGGMIPLARSYDPFDRYTTPWMAAGIVTFVFLTSIIAG